MKILAMSLVAAGLLFACGDETNEQDRRTYSLDAQPVKTLPKGRDPLGGEPGNGSLPNQANPTKPGSSKPGPGDDDNASVPGGPQTPVPDLVIEDWQDVPLFENGVKTKSLSDIFARRKLLVAFPRCESKDACTRWLSGMESIARQTSCSLLVVSDYIDHIRFWRAAAGVYYTSVGSQHLKARMRALAASEAFVLDRTMKLVGEGEAASSTAQTHCR